MLVAIDIGNTHTVLGFFQKAKLVADFRITSSSQRTEDELWLTVQSFYSQIKQSTEEIHGVVIASVVPQLIDGYRLMAEKYLKMQPVIISSSLDLGITVCYDDPTKVGADRLCNAVAAYKKFGGPAIVIDFGTATTYDVISKKGEYLGGVIAPGLETSAADLHRRTAQLPRIDLHFPESVIGTTTMTSMQSGILYGAVDAAEGMIHRIKQIVGKHANVIATGGYARVIANMSSEIKYIEPWLVLEGARLIYERFTRSKERDKSLFN
ncbi:MAG: type III pantothenate kinase [Ignavibacteria bacterium]|nr:type III pantothenate kinase [Ignavibacteria bacterium]MBI3766346.1 type III pantothenate kinase [Ignavibacteriales bacterium]